MNTLSSGSVPPSNAAGPSTLRAGRDRERCLFPELVLINAVRFERTAAILPREELALDLAGLSFEVPDELLLLSPLPYPEFVRNDVAAINTALGTGLDDIQQAVLSALLQAAQAAGVSAVGQIQSATDLSCTLPMQMPHTTS